MSEVNKPPHQPRALLFSEWVDVRCYAQTISSHPSVSRGPAIQLDWTVVDNRRAALRDHMAELAEMTLEEKAALWRLYPRQVQRLSESHRRELLLANSTSPSEMEKFEKLIRQAKKQRKETLDTDVNSKTINDTIEELDDDNTSKSSSSTSRQKDSKIQPPKTHRNFFKNWLKRRGKPKAPPVTISTAEEYLQWRETTIREQQQEDMAASGMDPQRTLFCTQLPQFFQGKSACKNCSNMANFFHSWAVVHMYQCQCQQGGLCPSLLVQKSGIEHPTKQQVMEILEEAHAKVKGMNTTTTAHRVEGDNEPMREVFEGLQITHAVTFAHEDDLPEVFGYSMLSNMCHIAGCKRLRLIHNHVEVLNTDMGSDDGSEQSHMTASLYSGDRKLILEFTTIGKEEECNQRAEKLQRYVHKHLGTQDIQSHVDRLP